MKKEVQSSFFRNMARIIMTSSLVEASQSQCRGNRKILNPLSHSFLPLVSALL